MPDDFPDPTNHMALSISLSPGGALNWANIIGDTLHGGAISHATLESMIGRLGYCQTAVFGNFPCASIKPIYTKLYTQRHRPSRSPDLRRNLRWRWRGVTLRNTHPRRLSHSIDPARDGSYTDASFEEGPRGARIAEIPPPGVHRASAPPCGPFALRAA